MGKIEVTNSLLVGENITLKPVQTGDVRDIYLAVRESIPELKRWMSWVHDLTSEKDLSLFVKNAQAGWDAGREWHFAVRDNDDGILLGVCGLSHINEYYRFANLGYWVRTSRTGRGVASQASRLLARFAVEQLEMVRIEIVVMVDNHASLKAAQKAGAKREGILRNRMRIRDSFCDAVMHSIVPADLN